MDAMGGIAARYEARTGLRNAERGSMPHETEWQQRMQPGCLGVKHCMECMGDMMKWHSMKFLAEHRGY